LPCEQTTFAGRCSDGETARIVVRLSDGRYYASSVNPDGSPGRALVRGDDIYGPAGAPFGFYRRVPTGNPASTPPPSLAEDPLETIATVQAIDHAYHVALAGTETVGGYSTYHLRLQPLREPDLYPLRDLWVDRANSQVVRLTYQQPFNATHAVVQYDFAPAGSPPTWVITHIAAHAGRESISQDLHDITFPATEPAENFEARSQPRY
jgi:hypothetical protein